MKLINAFGAALVLFASFVTQALAEDNQPLSQVLITNAKVFDGRSDKLTGPISVLVEGNKIKQIGATIDATEMATVIDAGGRVMTPGFIDSHSHLMFQLSFGEAFSSDEFYWAYVATQAAEIYLDKSGEALFLKTVANRVTFVYHIE